MNHFLGIIFIYGICLWSCITFLFIFFSSLVLVGLLLYIALHYITFNWVYFHRDSLPPGVQNRPLQETESHGRKAEQEMCVVHE